MSTITSILGTDLPKDSRAVINTNFSNLNTDKAEKTGKLSQFASTSSSELDWVISDNTGSGWFLVFSNSPALTTPSIAAINVSGWVLTLPTGSTATIATEPYALVTPDFYKYSIVTSVASGNLTVALKNYEGNNPTTAKPVKIQIGGVVRTITSALSCVLTAGSNYYNAGSSELATKEIDYFVNLMVNTSSGNLYIGASRIIGTRKEDFVAYPTTTSEKFLPFVDGIWAGDPVVNIGRFNATLSAGAGYTWSIGTSLIINQPTYQTRYLDYVPVGTGYTAGWAKYRIDWNNVNVIIDSTANITGNITVPFTCTNTVDNQMITNAGTAVLPKNSNTITVATNPQNISWFYWI